MTVRGTDVTVVMTVRDGERYLDEALDSVFGQRDAPGEVVVVDDGSRDRTAELLAARAPQLRVIRQPPRGFASGINRAVAAASRDVLAFLDADDEWTPDALGARLAQLADDPEADGVVGLVQQFVSPELPSAAAERFRFDPEPAPARLFGTMIVSRGAFLRVGPLDEHLAVGSAIDWISRAESAGLRFARIDDVVLRRRLHGANVGRTTSDQVMQRSLHDVVRAHHRRQLDARPTPVDP